MAKFKLRLIRVWGGAYPLELEFRQMGMQLRINLISSSRSPRKWNDLLGTCSRQQGFNDVKEVVYERVPSKLDGHQTRFQGCRRDVTLKVKAGFRIN